MPSSHKPSSHKPSQPARRKPVSSKLASSPAAATRDSTAYTLIPDLDRAQALVLELMAIPGKSGEEADVAAFIREKLLAAGAPADAIKSDNAHKQALIAGNTGNLILKLPGTVKGPRRMLSAHLDTVPICVGCQPLVEGNVVRSANPATGLGADNRAGCGTILSAALDILEHDLPHPPLTFCWFIQEEVGLYGARNVQQSLLGKPAMCFNWDGGAPEKVTIGATGGYRMVIDVQGIASHAGVHPEQGVSAIAIASIAIADLARDGWHGLVQKGKLRGTSNVGYIHGGEATNVVTDRVTLKAEARSHDPAFRQKIIDRIERAFHGAAKEVVSSDGRRGTVKIDGRLDYEAFLIDRQSPCVALTEQAIAAVGRQPELAISNGGLDANWLNAHGIPTVTLGCGQKNVHMTSEELDLAGYRDACRIALALATAE
jgi:tripeptide aminopeptidase